MQRVELRSTDPSTPLRAGTFDSAQGRHLRRPQGRHLRLLYFVAGDSGFMALSCQAVYHKLSSIWEPAASLWMVKARASGVPLPVNPPAFSRAYTVSTFWFDSFK